MTAHGFIVVRRDAPASHEWAVGDEVETYELLAGLPPAQQPTDRALHRWDAHGEARRQAPEAQRLLKSGQWRRVRTHACDCRSTTALVTEIADTSGRRWALVTRPEQIPPAFQRIQHGEEPRCWPLHREPQGTPHIDFAKCPRCRRVWCVALTESEIRLIPTRPTYGARVVP